MNTNEQLTEQEISKLLNLSGLLDEIDLAHSKNFIGDVLYDKLCRTIAQQLSPYYKHPHSNLMVRNIGMRFPEIQLHLDTLTA